MTEVARVTDSLGDERPGTMMTKRYEAKASYVVCPPSDDRTTWTVWRKDAEGRLKYVAACAEKHSAMILRRAFERAAEARDRQ